jgi:predicted O-linked N-acetylglucosamine transferase (SPINDLY family)
MTESAFAPSFPVDPVAMNARGLALMEAGDFNAALECFGRAIAVRPGLADAHHNQGRTLWALGRLAQAQASFARALELAPGRTDSFDGLAQTALHLCDWAQTETLRPQLESRVAAGELLPPWLVLGYSGDAHLQLKAARDNIAACIPSFPHLWRGERYGHRRIRVGYISGDFRQHVLGSQIAELIERHDRSRFEIIGLATSGDDASTVRARLARAFDAFHDLSAMDHVARAARLRQLEIDVLVDLAGHTLGQNFAVLAQRPAPVLLSWLGYAGTTGADFLDGLIVDKVVAPDPSEFSERLLPLAGSFFVSDTTRVIAPAPSRVEAGLPAEGFVFCSFNNSWKITAPVFAIWMRLLRQIDGSVLWLRQSGGGADANLGKAAADQDVDPARILFAPHVPDDVHLARHACADLFLDTLPYNAHATACDALWAGLPVLTRRGTAFAGRVAASLLTALGLAELISETEQDYESLALALARDPARLAALRARLAVNRKTMPLFDTAGFARGLEALYTTLV